MYVHSQFVDNMIVATKCLTFCSYTCTGVYTASADIIVYAHGWIQGVGLTAEGFPNLLPYPQPSPLPPSFLF